jgi:hypothetical protein
MFPNARLLIAATIATIVALSCGFGMFAALRVNHEPFARLPPGAAPLQLLASISPSPPIIVAAVEPPDRGLRTGETHAGADLADAQPRASSASDRATGAPSTEAETAAAPVSNASATMAAPPTQTATPPQETTSLAADRAAAANPALAPAPAPGVAAVEAPADQSVMVEQAGQDTVLVPASLPVPAARTATAARKKKKKTAHTRLADKTHHPPVPPRASTEGFANSNAQELPVGGPFVSPAAW